jgi:hypothetical protein
MEVRSEPLEQALLTSISDRIAGREGAEPDVQPDGDTHGGVLADRGRSVTGQRPRHRTSGEPDGACEIGNAEARHAATALDLGEDARLVIRSSADRAGERTVPRRHDRIVADGASLAVIRVPSGHHDRRHPVNMAREGSNRPLTRHFVLGRHDPTLDIGAAGRSAHTAHGRRRVARSAARR